MHTSCPPSTSDPSRVQPLPQLLCSLASTCRDCLGQAAVLHCLEPTGTSSAAHSTGRQVTRRHMCSCTSELQVGYSPTFTGGLQIHCEQTIYSYLAVAYKTQH
jgi:hypothetical protein